MAILRNGINGGFSGKLGNVVGAMNGDQCYLRSKSKPSKKNKIGSVTQNRYRLRFKHLHTFLKPLLYFIRVGFNMNGRALQLSAYNAAKSYNLLHAVNHEGVLDYPQILLTKGQLPQAEQLQVRANDTGFHFTWSNGSPIDSERLSDQFMMVAYPIGDFPYYSLSSNRRSQLQDSLSIPDFERGKTFRIWASFIADNRECITDSTYLGELVFE